MQDSPTAKALRPTIILCLVAIAAALAFRLLGPSDLYQNTDQGRTMALTTDIAINGEWLLPRDLYGERTKKPPMVNWIGAPIYAAGWRTEFALKLPSLLAGLATVALTALAGALLYRRLADQGAHPNHPTHPPRTFHPADPKLAELAPALGLAAGAAWLASNSGLKHVYFLRPDMLMIACLIAGWLCAMVATRDTKPGHDTTTKPERRWLAATWLCAGLAALAKGPMALLIPLFLLLDTLLKPRRDNDPPRLVRLARLGWGWGVPLMLALPLAWLAAAWQVDAAHVRDELLGAQLAPRLEKTTVGFDPAEAVRGLWRVPGFAVERFAPWSILAVVGIIAMGQHWRSSPLRPALVWAAGVFAIALLDGGRSGSTIAPAYPALALLAVYGLARLIAGNDGRRAGSAALAAAAIVLVAALAVGAREAFLSRGARSDLGQQLKAFARQAERIVGDDHVVYLGTWHNPIPTLMGRARIGQPSAELFRQADWVVMTVDDRYPRVAESPDLVRLHGDFDGPRGEPERLGLYKREDLPESVLQDHDDPRW